MICPVCGGRKSYQAPWCYDEYGRVTEFRTIPCDYCNGTGEVDEDYPEDDFSGVTDNGAQRKRGVGND